METLPTLPTSPTLGQRPLDVQPDLTLNNTDLLKPPPRQDDDESVFDGSVHSDTPTASSHAEYYGDQAEKTRKIEDFNSFQWDCKSLEETLERFSNSVQTIGSAIILLRTSRSLQQDLRVVRFLLEGNARKLFPRGLNLPEHIRPTHESVILQEMDVNMRHSAKGDKLEIQRKTLTKALGSLAKTLEAFFSAIEDFPEFVNEDGRRNIFSFIGTVENWSTAIQITDKFEKAIEFRQLIHQMTVHISHCVRNLNKALEVFMTIGIPCITAAQKRSFDLLLNIATTATFLSAVTASTLQYTFSSTDSVLDVTINTFWLSSLVLSIAAATNSLLTLAWRQAVYSTPRTKVPWWVLIWFKQSCLVLLSSAVVTFMAGLLFFVVKSQHLVSVWIVAGLSILCFAGLGSVTVWFALERLEFRKVRNAHRRLHLQYYRPPQMSWLKRIRDRSISQLAQVIHICTPRKFSPEDYDLEKTDSNIGVMDPEMPETTEKAPRGAALWGVARDKISRSTRWQTLGNRLIADRAAENDWKDALPSLTVRAEEAGQWGAIRHMQFSPTGSWLVSCSRHSCCVYHVKDNLKLHQELPSRSHIHQAEWSPDSKRLLTSGRRSFKIWCWDGQDKLQLEKRIPSRAESKQVLWLDNKEFISLSDNSLYKISRITGKIVDELTLRSLGFRLRDSYLMHFTLDRVKMFRNSTQGLLVVSQVHSHESSSLERPWKHVFLINISTRRLDHLKMSLDSLTGMSLSHDGRHVLLGYENKCPEIWTFDSQRRSINIQITCISPPTYNTDVIFGPSQFTGPRQSFITSVDSEGNVFTWKRESGELINTKSLDTAIHHRMIPLIVWRHGQRPTLAKSHGTDGRLQLWYCDQPAGQDVNIRSHHTSESRASSPSPLVKAQPSWVDVALRRPKKETGEGITTDKRRSFGSASTVSFKKAFPSRRQRHKPPIDDEDYSNAPDPPRLPAIPSPGSVMAENESESNNLRALRKSDSDCQADLPNAEDGRPFPTNAARPEITRSHSDRQSWRSIPSLSIKTHSQSSHRQSFPSASSLIDIAIEAPTPVESENGGH